MKVLKFGGTSVANAESLKLVVDIIKKTTNQKQFVVVSAIGGVTNLLIEMANSASQGKTNFKKHIKNIEKRHLDIINSSVPVTQQSGIISFLKSQLNELEGVLESLFTLRELTPKSLAKISSYGEIFSSTIIFELLKHQEINVFLKDARTLIFTRIINDKEVVDHEKSSESCQPFIASESASVILLPGLYSERCKWRFHFYS